MSGLRVSCQRHVVGVVVWVRIAKIGGVATLDRTCLLMTPSSIHLSPATSVHRAYARNQASRVEDFRESETRIDQEIRIRKHESGQVKHGIREIDGVASCKPPDGSEELHSSHIRSAPSITTREMHRTFVCVSTFP
jgi:hypothetical protein